MKEKFFIKNYFSTILTFSEHYEGGDDVDSNLLYILFKLL